MFRRLVDNVLQSDAVEVVVDDLVETCPDGKCGTVGASGACVPAVGYDAVDDLETALGQTQDLTDSDVRRILAEHVAALESAVGQENV